MLRPWRPSRKAAQYASHLLTRVPGELITTGRLVALRSFSQESVLSNSSKDSFKQPALRRLLVVRADAEVSMSDPLRLVAKTDAQTYCAKQAQSFQAAEESGLLAWELLAILRPWRPSRKAAQHASHLLTRVPGELITTGRLLASRFSLKNVFPAIPRKLLAGNLPRSLVGHDLLVASYPHISWTVHALFLRRHPMLACTALPTHAF